MIIDIDKCIGCGNCVRACSKENNVPEGYFRTWVERYQAVASLDRERWSSGGPAEEQMRSTKLAPLLHQEAR
jgi:Fe-S-cluster-containing dehydrogenase component